MGSTLFQVTRAVWTGQGTLRGVQRQWASDAARCHSYIQCLPEIIPSGGRPTPVPYVPNTPNRHSSAPVSE